MKRITCVGLGSLVVLSLTLPLPKISLVKADEAQLQTQPQIPRANRKRIAVLDFDFAATGITQAPWYYRLFPNGSPAKGMSDLITNKLVENGSYSVIERGKIAEILKEQNMGLSGRIEPTTAAQIGRILGVDAVLIGTITRFNLEERGSKGVLNFVGIGGGAKKQKAVVELTSRLVSTNTGEILASAQGDGKSSETGGSLSIFGLGSGGTDADKTDTLLSNAAEQATVSIVTGIANAAPKLATLPDVLPNVKALVADVTGNTVTVNKGDRDGLKPGMILSIEHVVKVIKDPQTGAVIRQQTSPIAKLKITDVDSTSAVGTIMTANGKIKVGDVAKSVTE
jgi:curli biogenesis system outer membrane secretion channel CsgG